MWDGSVAGGVLMVGNQAGWLLLVVTVTGVARGSWSVTLATTVET